MLGMDCVGPLKERSGTTQASETLGSFGTPKFIIKEERQDMGPLYSFR